MIVRQSELIIIKKGISIVPIDCTWWEHRALYNNARKTLTHSYTHIHAHTHTHTHTYTYTHTHTHTCMHMHTHNTTHTHTCMLNRGKVKQNKA